MIKWCQNNCTTTLRFEIRKIFPKFRTYARSRYRENTSSRHDILRTPIPVHRESRILLREPSCERKPLAAVVSCVTVAGDTLSQN